MKQIFFTLSLLFLSGIMTSQTVYNNADGDFQWLNPNNWTNGLPAVGNDATINALDSVAIVLTMDTNMNFTIQNNGVICLLEGDWELALSGVLINDGIIRFKNNGVGVVDFDMFTNNGEVYSQETLNNFEFLVNNGIFHHGGLINNVVNGVSTPTITNSDCAIFIAEDGSDMTDGTFINEGIVYVLGNAVLTIDTQNGLVLNDLATSPTPTANCINTSFGVQLVGMNTVTVLPGMIDNGSDAAYCSTGLDLSLSQMQFNCSHVGDNIVTLTVTDGLGNTTTCTATVTIVDSTPPTATCPSDITINLAPGACDSLVVFDLQEMDNCGAPTITQLDPSGLQSGDSFPIGVTPLIFQISDASASVICAFSITINEFIPSDDVISCVAAVQLSLGGDCTACVSASQILQGDYGCYDDFTVEVGNLGTECVDVTFIDQTVIVTITSNNTGNSCTSEVTIEDKFLPQIFCQDDTVSCAAPFDIASVAAVTYTDNCDANPTLTLINEVFFNSLCINPEFNAVIIRDWRVEDVYGNIANCTQTIRIKRGHLADVIFPDSIIVDCTSPYTPDVTGFPTLDGFPISIGMPECNLTAIYTDQLSIDNCSQSNFTVFRTWTVDDACGAVTQTIQLIKVKDTTAPVLTCPGDLTISTDANDCSATFTLPEPTATDDCSGAIVWAVIANTTMVTDFTIELTNMQIGNYSVTYFAQDSCGNESSCMIDLVIIDDIVPTAVCKTELNVNLPNTGTACLDAELFDNGSFDNCPGLLDFTVSRDMINFFDCVEVNCEDIGTIVMLAVKVSSTVNPASFSICMVEVNVFDKIAPFLDCPSDLTIDCNNSIGDLSVFGEPTYWDSCGATLVVDSLIDISNCGEGTIERYFTVTDPSDNVSNCTQIITIDNMNPFDGTGIIFPSDTIIENQCPDITELSVEMLGPNGQPTLPSVPCALLAVNYSDQLFNIEFPACYKVVRTWTIIDWCQYDADSPNPTGTWTDQQIIKIIDTEAPVITNCPADITVGLDANCEFGEVFLSDVTATDCSLDIEITNNSTVPTLSGANASGMYTAGTHTVVFSVKDGCSNKSTCDVVITVEDLKQPTPYCNGGIAAELQQMSGGIMAMVDVNIFNAGSYDNCTANEDLVLNIGTLADTSGVPTTTMLTYDCFNLGNNDVVIWVTDENGNSDYCITNIQIQDNMELCGSGLVAGISGDVMTEVGNTVEEVTVLVSSGSNALPDITLSSGSFAVPNLPLGQTYEVIPEKDVNENNGVSTFDLVLLKRHVLNVDHLDTPYKIIAADVNNSGSLSTLDLVWMQKMILQMVDEFPNNTSWRFVDMDYDFINPESPLNESFPEVITVEGLPPEGVETDFYGIKVGDLNNSANANSLMGTDDRSFADELSFTVENQRIKKGEIVQVDFAAKDFKNILGFQFTFEFDQEALSFVEFQKGNLASLNEVNFGFHNLELGRITSSWYDLDQPKVKDTEKVFSFTFEALTDGQLSDFIEINAAMTTPEAYNSDEELLNVVIEFDQAFDSSRGFELSQNRPNPFGEETEIEFYLPEASGVTFSIYDLDGQLLKTQQMNYEKGWQKLKIDASEIDAKGVLYYRIETETEVATRKMIKF